MLKKRSVQLTVGTDGATTTASKSLGLGKKYARAIFLEGKGDDANVNATTALTITDSTGRIIYTDVLDWGTDDSTEKQTEQSFSTVGLGVYLQPEEAEAFDRGGTAAAAASAGSVGIPCVSPLTVALASGTDGDVFKFHVWVEV